MFAVQYLVPCMERSEVCNLDWVAITAIGAWVAAIVTAVAVVVALKSAKNQGRAAEHAAIAERSKAEHIQQREWDESAKAHRRTAMHLASAFARELGFARRQLVPLLLNWDPERLKFDFNSSSDKFVSDQPLDDLVFLRSCADRLHGFDDEDAFALLTVLTTWQFFNRSPGLSIDDLVNRSSEDRRTFVYRRVRFGLELLGLIESSIERMRRYCEGREPEGVNQLEGLTELTAKSLADLRSRVK